MTPDPTSRAAGLTAPRPRRSLRPTRVSVRGGLRSADLIRDRPQADPGADPARDRPQADPRADTSGR